MGDANLLSNISAISGCTVNAPIVRRAMDSASSVGSNDCRTSSTAMVASAPSTIPGSARLSNNSTDASATPDAGP